MDTPMEEILRQAQGLGQAIRQHPRYRKLMETDAKVRADPAATEAVEAYNRAYGGLVQKEQRGQPIEVDEKHRLDRLKQVVAANETFKTFLKAQADYAELMQQMNAAIFKAISGGGQGDGAAPA